METTSAKQKDGSGRIAFIALTGLVLLIGYSLYKALLASGVPEESLRPGEMRIGLVKPYIIACVVGGILAIQGIVLIRRKERPAAAVLCTVATLLLGTWLILCGLGVINP